MVKIEIYFKSQIYDITDLVEVKSIKLGLTGDRTLDNGSFIIPDVSRDHFTDLDMGRSLPRLSRVRIELNGVIHNGVIQADNVRRIADSERYVHQVSISSPSKLMVDMSSSAITVTQPQGDIGLYYRTVSKFDDPREFSISNSYRVVNYTTRSNAADLNVLDGFAMKSTGKHKIDIALSFRNYTGNNVANISTKVLVKIEWGSNSIIREVTAAKNKLWPSLTGGSTDSHRNLTLEIDNVGSNTLSISLSKEDMPSANNLSLTESTVSIYTSNEYTMDLIRLDYVVEKLLNNELNKQNFYLDDDSKALLSRYTSYEWTIPEGYIWLQIIRIADYIKAFPKAYYEDDEVNSRIMVQIIPFDDLAFEEVPPLYDIEQLESKIDDYASAIEINAGNIYSENAQIEETTTLRVDGVNAQITTEGLIIPTQQRIGQIIAIEISFNKAVTVGSKTYPAEVIYRITNGVFDKRYYDTLSTESDYSLNGRQSYNQNNTLYFIEGEKNIMGLSNLGGRVRPSSWQTSNYSRAIYEVVLAHLARIDDANPSNIDDGTVALDNSVRVIVTYRPYVETNAVVFKDDQSGFEFKTRKLLNESMAINSPDIIGIYAQGIANRSGGTEHTYSGVARPDQIPDVLSRWDNKVLFGVNIEMLNETLCSFTLYYVRDYVFISAYESYDKKERIYQVSTDNVLERVIKKNSHIIFSELEGSSTTTGFKRNISDFIVHLTNQIIIRVPPQYARMDCSDNNGNVAAVALPISIQAFGKVIEFRFKPKDNYSAGIQKYQSGTNWYQKDYSYVNLFGRIENVRLRLYSNIANRTVQTLNDMPKSPDFDISTLAFDLDYNLRKDAREIPVFSIQYNYISESNNIIVYDDIARGSIMANRTDRPYYNEVLCAELDYVPTKNTKLIDLTRSTTLPVGSVTFVNDGTEKARLLVSGNSWKPIAIYDTRNLELLLVDKRELRDRTIYVRSSTEVGDINYEWQSRTTLSEPFDYTLGINEPLPSLTASGLKVRRLTGYTESLTWQSTGLKSNNIGGAILGDQCYLLGSRDNSMFGFADIEGDIKFYVYECRGVQTPVYEYFISVIV